MLFLLKMDCSNVKKSLRYILNPDKTEELLYTASINCMTDAEAAYLQMQLVYDQFARDRFNSHAPLGGQLSFADVLAELDKVFGRSADKPQKDNAVKESVSVTENDAEIVFDTTTKSDDTSETTT